MTTSSDYLAKHQKEYPPHYAVSQGLDRVQQLYKNLEPYLPPGIQSLYSNGLLVAGEVGLNTPDVQKITLPDGCCVIEFTSGMMDFVYAVARTLCGRFIRNTVSGSANQAALAMPEVEQETAKLFMQWKWYKRWLWKLRPIRYPEFKITEGVHKWAEGIATIAELFMLSHEIGHIVLEKKILPPRSANAEQDADTIAMMLVSEFANKKGEDPAFMFAGAVFAIRIFAGLEKVGVRFSSVYPPQTERIANISACTLSLCPSKQYFHEISRIAVAYQDMMDDVEDHIVKRPGPVNPDGERITVRLIAELLEVALGRAPKDKLIADITKITEQTSTGMMRQVTDTLNKYYVTSAQNGTFIDQDTKRTMGALIREVLPHLHSKAR